jgi:hypothetical protein
MEKWTIVVSCNPQTKAISKAAQDRLYLNDEWIKYDE